MLTSSRILLFLFLALTAAGSAFAQDKPRKEPEPFMVPIPERMERATKADDNGVLQWAEFQDVECVNCKGKGKMTCRHCERFDDGMCPDCPECHNTREATCRVCAGTGKMPDILLRAPCPSCGGAGLTACSICAGMGQMKVNGAGDKPQKCGCCKGTGGFTCLTCNGRRYVDTPKLKPNVAEAKLAELKKAMEALQQVMDTMQTLESTGDGRKDMKLYAKVVAPGQKFFPPLKDAQKHFEAEKKAEANGSVWTKYADCVRADTKNAKDQLEYYLKCQKRLLELCIARAESNEPAGGKK